MDGLEPGTDFYFQVQALGQSGVGGLVSVRTSVTTSTTSFVQICFFILT